MILHRLVTLPQLLGWQDYYWTTTFTYQLFIASALKANLPEAIP